MATLSDGYMGGFSGKLGTAVGYQWKGRWCLRSLPKLVRNPRTEAQQNHRMLFKQEVQLAGHMRRALNIGLGLEADNCQMTAPNLFVKLNQQAFGASAECGEPMLAVDWERLIISMGPVAPVAFGVPTLTAGTTLDIDFESNPLHQRADRYDSVYLYVYCPELERGYLAAPVYRMTRHIAVVLPESFAGRALVLYAFVQDEQGRCSQTIYIYPEAPENPEFPEDSEHPEAPDAPAFTAPSVNPSPTDSTPPGNLT